MKKKFTSIITFSLFLIFTSSSFAQIEEVTKRMSLGEQNAYSCTIETTDIKGVEKVWKKYFKEYGKTKKNRKANEWQSKKPVFIPKSSTNTYDVYIKFLEENDAIEAYLWVDTGEYFVNSATDNNESKKIKTMLEGFRHKTEVYLTESLLDEENHKLKKLEKEQRKLEKNNKKYHTKVENAKNTIIEFEEKIEQNIKYQATTKDEIDAQRDRVQKVQDNLNKLH